MIITEFKNRFSTTGKSVELTWDDLVERLKSPVITSETLAEYKAMTNEERTAIKDIGGYVAGEFTDDKRNKNLLKNRCVLTIDADEATAEDIDNYSCLYDNAVFIHTTHTSTDEQLRLRWLFPLSRPVSAEEYKALVNIVIHWVGSNTVDDTTDQPERLMFWPSICSGAEYHYWNIAGDVIDPDVLLEGVDLNNIEPEEPRGKLVSGTYTDGELYAIEEGGRNKSLFNYLAKQREWFGFDEDALYNVGRLFNDRYCVPPLPEFELRNTIHSVLRYPAGDPIPFASRDAKMDFKDLGAGNKKKVWLENGDELMNRHIEPLEFVIPDILPIGLGVLYSPPKYGKSFFVLDLAISVATGTKFLNLPTNKNGVLYISLEDIDANLKDRMGPIIKGRGDLSNFYHVHEALTLQQGFTEQLDAYVETYPDIRLIIVDTFVRIRGTAQRNEGAYEHDYKELSILKQWVTQKKVGILLVHHTRKTLDSDDFVMNVNGTSGITGAADFIYGMTRRARNDPTTVLNITGRFVRSKSFIIQFNEMNLRWENLGEEKDVRETAEDAAYRNDPVVKTIVHFLDEAEDVLDQENSEVNEAVYTITTPDLIRAVEQHTKDETYSSKPRAMRTHLSQIQDRLLEKDGITCSEKKQGNMYWHSFSRERW